MFYGEKVTNATNIIFQRGNPMHPKVLLVFILPIIELADSNNK
jgi:hypothetical protein